MKSGPALAEATVRPRFRNAAMSPVATVVLPTPDAVPATTRRGPSTGTAGFWHRRRTTGTEGRRPGVDSIVSNVVQHAGPGKITLMQDAGGNRSQTVQALPQILGKSSQQGYRFERLPGC